MRYLRELKGSPLRMGGLFAVLTLLGAGLALAQSTGERPDPAQLEHDWITQAWRSENGNIKPGGLEAAADHMRRLASRSRKSPGHDGWKEVGPANVQGRSRALLVDPRDPSHLILGTAGGGIWNSFDAGTTWASAGDKLPSLSIGSLAYQPDNPDVVYAGTGEGYFNNDAITGVGILKSTDGGLTWSLLPSTTYFGNVNRIAVSPTDSNRILAATAPGGLMLSTDGGFTWSNPLPTSACFQVTFDPTNGNKALATCRDLNGLFAGVAMYSTDAGATWTQSTGLTQTGFQRIELAYARSNTNIVYANPTWNGKIYKSTNGGQLFTQITPNTTGKGSSGATVGRDSLFVDPTDPNKVVTGGVNVGKSTDAGGRITSISDGTLVNNPHVGINALVPDPRFDGATNKALYICTDAGLYKSNDIYLATKTTGWVGLTQNLPTGQFYGVAGDFATGLIIGGAQDYGTALIPAGSATSTKAIGVNGGFVAMDPTDANTFYGSYGGSTLWRTLDGGTTVTSIAPPSSTANYVPPICLRPDASQTLLFGNAQLWRTTNSKAVPPTWTSIKNTMGTGGVAISSIAARGDLAIVGYADGQLYVTNQGNASAPVWTAITALPHRYVSCLQITSDGTIFAGFGGFESDNLWKSTDGGANWTNICGAGATALPAAPVRAFVQDPDVANVFTVGTEVGICQTIDGGANWSSPSVGPSNASVFDLRYMNGSGTLLAATHGRGIWKYSPLAPLSFQGPTSVYTGTQVQYTIKLDGVAGVGGVNIDVVSNDPVLVVPATVNVPQGQTSVTFNASCGSAITPRPVTLTATVNGNTSTLDVQVIGVVASTAITPVNTTGGTSKVPKLKITLNAPAPAGGLTFALTSSNPTVASIQPSVTVKVGSKYATVPLTDYVVSTDTVVTFDVTYGDEVKHSNLTVLSPRPLKVVLTPISVVGGSATTVKGTLTITGPAPAGGLTVNLSSTVASAAAPPATVTVAEGATVATFNVSHFPVNPQKSPNIRATAAGTTKGATLTVLPPTVKSVAVSPANVTGGSDTEVLGTVTLNAPAPPTGIKVTLASDSTHATVPAYVTVAAGDTTATFPVIHTSVSTDSSATISATFGLTKTDTLTLKAPVFTAFTLSRSSVQGGSATVVTGTLTINAPAPDGGFTITLSSSNTGAAEVPATVTIPAGATSAMFNVTHHTVGGSTAVTLTAVGGAVTKVRTLTVNP